MTALQICKAALEEIAVIPCDCGYQNCGNERPHAARKARAALEAAAKVGDAPTLTHRAEEAVDAIVEDLSDRRGLKREWRQIDSDIQAEIKLVWAQIIIDAYLRGAR